MAEASTRQGVDVTVDPGATLLKGLEDYWSDRGNDIFVNFIKKREGQNTMRSKHDGCVVATVDITEFNIGGTNIHRWMLCVFAPLGSGLSRRVRYCISKHDLAGKIVHV